MLIYQKDLPIRLGAVVVVQTQLSAKTLNMCVYSQLFWKEENKELEACNGAEVRRHARLLPNLFKLVICFLSRNCQRNWKHMCQKFAY